jgi:DMSO/TMAO reductase YedYZ heme-binding membrane subunit
MAIEKKGYILIFAILLTLVIVFLIIYSIDHGDPLDLLMRLCGLYGFLGISISAIMTPFLKEIKEIFGRIFIEVHHVTAAIGIACITVHPIIFAIQNESAMIFVPDFSSWLNFWIWAGRPALILLYIAFFAVLIRRQIPKYWRSIHILMYVVLLFGIVHANLMESDFSVSPILLAFYNALFGAVVLAFILKRWQRSKLKKPNSSPKSPAIPNAEKI